MKVLVTDSIDKAGVELLEEIAEVEVETGLPPEELKKRIRDADALMIRSATKVTADVIDAAKKLKVIGRAGVGVDNVDLKAATRKGILVVNAPESSSITVAEHAMGLILALARKIPPASSSLKDGKWEKKRFMGVELRGKNLGVVGLGRIGSQVVIRAKGFGMNILGYDPYVSEDYARELGIELLELDELLKRSDMVSLHVPKTKDTENFIGEKELAKMKKGAYLINASRGGIIDEEALFKALESGRLGGAALDVFNKEPPSESPLLKLENVIATPHLGASTEEAQRNAAVITAEEIRKVLLNKTPKNVVNMPVFDQEVVEKARDYLPLAEKMGQFGIGIVGGGIESVSVTYCGEIAELKEFDVLTNSVLKGMLTPILTGSVNLFNAPMVARKRGIKVTESKREYAEGHSALIVVDLKGGRHGVQIKGVLLGKELPRIVGIDGYAVEVTPEGRIMLVRHEDRPGMIGKVATALGDNGINIGFMEVGRKEVGGIQLMILSIDTPIPKPVLDVINLIDGVEEVKIVEL